MTSPARAARLVVLVVVLGLSGASACAETTEQGSVSSTGPTTPRGSVTSVPTSEPTSRDALFDVLGVSVDLRRALILESIEIQRATVGAEGSDGTARSVPSDPCPQDTTRLDEAVADFRVAVGHLQAAGWDVESSDGNVRLASRFDALPEERRAACELRRDPIEVVDGYIETASEVVAFEADLIPSVTEPELERVLSAHAALAGSNDAQLFIASQLLVPVRIGFFPVYTDELDQPLSKTDGSVAGCGEDPSQAEDDECPSWSRPARAKGVHEDLDEEFVRLASPEESRMVTDVLLSSRYYDLWNIALQNGVGMNDVRAPGFVEIEETSFFAAAEHDIDEYARVEHELLETAESDADQG